MDAAGIGVTTPGGAAQTARTERRSPARFDINMHDNPGLRFPDEADDLRGALDAFRAEARKSPTQRCREQVMKEWRVTPDSLAAMPPGEARRLEARIEAEVTRRLHAEAGAQPPIGGAPGPASDPAHADDGGVSTLEALGARVGTTVIAQPR